jgi:hypothetical protein
MFSGAITSPWFVTALVAMPLAQPMVIATLEQQSSACRTALDTIADGALRHQPVSKTCAARHRSSAADFRTKQQKRLVTKVRTGRIDSILNRQELQHPALLPLCTGGHATVPNEQ